MSGALLSGHWFRVAHLRPRLRSHTRIRRQVFRKKVWYVIDDRVSGQFHRFNPEAYRVIRQLDGRRTMRAIWDGLVAGLRDDTPTQDDVIQLLNQLNTADLLVLDALPEVAELIDRRNTRERKKWMARFLNPLSLRFPLWDPDAFLAALAKLVPPMSVAVALLVWCAAVIPALLLVPGHWPDLTRNFGERFLAANNLWVAAFVFPLLKIAHEMAHGLAVKRGDGEVHEMGLMLLLFYPVPYVDASAAHGFRSKRRRVWVGGAGMAIEIWLASIAFVAWTMMEPGLVRSVAYNMVVLGTVTTVLFNANPLLRYDGYYMLADAIEIPNLGQRANQLWQFLATRFVFGVAGATPPHATAGERRWFLAYAPLAFLYRLSVTLGIAWFVAQQYFVFGILIAAWGMAAGFLLPAYKAVAALLTQPQFLARAGRVRAVLGLTAAFGLLVLFVLPMPYHTRAEGVVSLPEQALLRAGSDGFVMRVLVPGEPEVAADLPVVETFNPALSAQIAQQEARVEETLARLDAVWGREPAEAGRLAEDLKREKAALERLTEEAARLVVRAPSAGRLLLERAQDLPGRFVPKGEVLGYLVGEHVPIVRVVVGQDEVDRVRAHTQAVEVRMCQDLGRVLPGELVRAVPKGGKDLPSAALGQAGGGSLAVDPRDQAQTTAMQSVFEFQVRLPGEPGAVHLGSRAYVSFEHPAEPMGWRWLRQARRLFLSRLEV